MELVANILLVAGALGAGFYCFVLARRLNKFNDLEKGVGGAVSVLSAQAEDLNKTLLAARTASDGSNAALEDLTARAEAVANRLELLIASLHDIPDQPEQQETPRPRAEQQEAPRPRAEPQEPAGPMFVRHGRQMNGAGT